MFPIFLFLFFSSCLAQHPQKCSVMENKTYPLYTGGSEKIIDFYTFGDSHSVCATPNLFEKAGNVRWHNFYMGSRLMYGIGRDGLKSLNVKKRVITYLPNSIAMFSFGAIDARRKIHLYQNQEGKDNKVIENMIEKYEKVLLENEKMVPKMHFWILGLPPPSDRNPIFIKNTLIVNEHLKKMCQRNSWFFLEIYSDYKDKYGYLEWELSDTINHISSYLPITQERVAEEIEKIRKIM